MILDFGIDCLPNVASGHLVEEDILPRIHVSRKEYLSGIIGWTRRMMGETRHCLIFWSVSSARMAGSSDNDGLDTLVRKPTANLSADTTETCDHISMSRY
jgi:hypothetical protein